MPRIGGRDLSRSRWRALSELDALTVDDLCAVALRARHVVKENLAQPRACCCMYACARF
jgi:hypothetical protein